VLGFDQVSCEMTDENISMQACGEWEPLLMLFAAGDELDPADHTKIAAHLSNCQSCSAFLTREREVLALLGENRVEPDASLLASCRTDFADALDREDDRGWLSRAFGWVLPTGWLAPRPAFSAAMLLLFGFGVGILAPRLLQHPVQPVAQNNSPIASSPASSDGSSPSISMASVPTALDLHAADVAGINMMPSGDGPARVELQLNSHQPVTVRGSVDDDDVKAVLLDVLAKGDRVCPDIRLQAVECLRSQSNEPDVREALCNAVHKDHNPAVRLKALEALNESDSHEMVRQTLLDALVDDDNPGVRVEAVNALRSMAAAGRMESDDRTLSILRDRMQKDPNTYIRLQSAAMVSELGPRSKF
jgi:HEAT repeats/Putative zinc-finger